MFGEYGTFLPASKRSHPRHQACPASKRSRKGVVVLLSVFYLWESNIKFLKLNYYYVRVLSDSGFWHVKQDHRDYNARHDLKPSAGEYGHQQKSDKTTTSSKISYDRADCLDDSLAGFTLYEARKLRSSADQLKAYGDEVEISEIYLDAGLKFLKGAYLLECYIIPTSRSRDASDAFHSYIDAAKLFKYCAETNKKNGNSEVTALAYKCMEVAYFRVAFALQHVCSSSQSILYKGESGMSWNIEPKTDNASQLEQLLSISVHATAAMDASMRSHRALELAIKHQSCTEGHETGGLSAVKKALDFSFYDVEEFVRFITLSLKDVGM